MKEPVFFNFENSSQKGQEWCLDFGPSEQPSRNPCSGMKTESILQISVLNVVKLYIREQDMINHNKTGFEPGALY